MIVELGDVIAKRTFRWAESSAEGLTVLIGRPVQFPDSEDYYVPYQIKGIGSNPVRYAGGVDSIQCLQLVMKGISAELDRIGNQAEDQLLWDGDETGRLGFDS